MNVLIPCKSSLTLTLSRREREFRVVILNQSNRFQAPLSEKCTHFPDEPYKTWLSNNMDAFYESQ